ncbi:MAG: branched-chain amino acid ABC transporter permease [Candidatus Izemoplasmatales bacterium]|nr:branched-chain amino acid ABC transporter permease [Candidatus Izemoplasmatales bacterium]
MDLFFQQLINALNTGSIYALVAIGYTMVYGIIRLINFAHGDIMMFGAYFAFIFASIFPFQLPVILIIIISMALAALMGVIIEKVAYKKLRKAPRISALITAIGMSLFLQNLALLIFKPEPKVMPVLISKSQVNIFGLGVPILTLYTIGISVLFMILLTLFVHKTKPGKAMRAVSQDQEAAMLMGINVNSIVSLTFAIGSALGALGGVFYSISYSQVYPTLGVMPGLKAFVAAVLGGIGNIGGAMLGGYIIGAIETFTNGYISTRWADAIVFSILIFVLLFKPSGILGKNTKEKV